MEWVETTGRTVEDAKDAALDQLGVDERDAEFDVLEEPRTGLFGRMRGEVDRQEIGCDVGDGGERGVGRHQRSRFVGAKHIDPHIGGRLADPVLEDRDRKDHGQPLAL